MLGDQSIARRERAGTHLSRPAACFPDTLGPSSSAGHAVEFHAEPSSRPPRLSPHFFRRFFLSLTLHDSHGVCASCPAIAATGAPPGYVRAYERRRWRRRAGQPRGFPAPGSRGGRFGRGERVGRASGVGLFYSQPVWGEGCCGEACEDCKWEDVRVAPVSLHSWEDFMLCCDWVVVA